MATFDQKLKMQRGLLSGLVALAAVIATAGPAAIVLIALFGSDQVKALDAYLLPILLIGGIVMFLVALCIVVTVFRKLGLASTNYALGLPEGSIRAFIALALILLFFMMGIYLYTGISKPDEVLTDLTEQEANEIPDERVAFRVVRDSGVDVHLNPSSAAGQDVARQMITTMSTLVVAIASFYFGTSAVQQAFTTNTSGAAISSTFALKLLEPQNMPRDLRRKGNDGWEPEKIRVRSSPADAQVVGMVDGDVASSIVAVDDSGVYTYTPSQPSSGEVKLTFSLVDHKEATLTVAYQVPPKGDSPGHGSVASPDPAAGPADVLTDEVAKDKDGKDRGNGEDVEAEAAAVNDLVAGQEAAKDETAQDVAAQDVAAQDVAAGQGPAEGCQPEEALPEEQLPQGGTPERRGPT